MDRSVTSRSRVLALQAGLKHREWGAMLFVLGIDGGFSAPTARAIDHLLFGWCGQNYRARDRKQSGGSDIRGSDELLEDVVLVVTPTSFQLICDPASYETLAPWVVGLPGLTVHCPTETEASDHEFRDLFKIRKFVDAVRGIRIVATALGGASAFDVVEKWPLVQSYALEGVGGGGFFTLKHQVVDSSPLLSELYAAVDAATVDVVLRQTVPQLQWHWAGFVARINALSDRSKIGLHSLVEPLRTFFQHGRSPDSSPPAPDMCRFEAFDAPGGAGLSHVVCETGDAAGLVWVARTLFFESAPMPLPALYALLIDTADFAVRKYVGAVVVGPNDPRHAIAAARAFFFEELVARELSIAKCEWEDCSFSCNISGHDAVGQPVDLSSTTRAIKFVKLRLVIPASAANDNATELAFSDTFVEAGPRVFEPAVDDGTKNIQNVDGGGRAWLMATNVIPPQLSWCSNPKVLERDPFALPTGPFVHTVLGELIEEAENCFVLLDCEPCSVKLSFFERAIVVSHPRIGLIVLTTGVGLGDSLGNHEALLNSVQLGSFDLRHDPIETLFLQCDGPVVLSGSESTILVKITEQVKAVLVTVVFPRWADGEEGPKIKSPIDLLNDLTPNLKALIDQIKLPILDPTGIGGELLHLDSLLDSAHVSTEFVVHAALLEDLFSHLPTTPMAELTAILAASAREPRGSSELLSGLSPDRIPIMIVTGVPGTGKARLCSSIVALAKDDIRWLVFRPDLQSSSRFDPKQLQMSMHNAVLGNERTKNSGKDGRQLRVLVITRGTTAVSDVVRTIHEHPDEWVRSKYTIESVCCCVDPANSFIRSRQPFPLLLEHCARGWCTAIVITGDGRAAVERAPRLAMIGEGRRAGPARSLAEWLVRVCNPKATLLRAEDGRIVDSDDFETLLSSSNHFLGINAVADRSIMTPGWSLPRPISNSTNDNVEDFRAICVLIKAPLNKARVDRTLKELIAASSDFGLSDTSGPCIYRIKARVFFDDSPQLFQLHFVAMSRHISYTPSKAGASDSKPEIQPYFAFTGTGLTEEVLKDWLSGCTLPPPQPEPLRTRETVSSSELEQICAMHKGEPLPDGYFYNGRQYCCMDGTKSITHPMLEKFVVEWLEDTNSAIEAKNAELAQSGPPPELFGRVRTRTPQKPRTPAPPTKSPTAAPKTVPTPPTEPGTSSRAVRRGRLNAGGAAHPAPPPPTPPSDPPPSATRRSRPQRSRPT